MGRAAARKQVLDNVHTIYPENEEFFDPPTKGGKRARKRQKEEEARKKKAVKANIRAGGAGKYQKNVNPIGDRQAAYVQALQDQDIVCVDGPAGTGKTYLAIVEAIDRRIRQGYRVVLSRPAVDADEDLGFLPGGEREKLDPYLRPLYDAMYDRLGGDMGKVEAWIQGMLLEIAAIGKLRGRTIPQSFIVIDEAQNCTYNQLKMILTRLGKGSTIVLAGDSTQVDLPEDKPSGFAEVMEKINGTPGVSCLKLTGEDIQRHPTVARIVKKL